MRRCNIVLTTVIFATSMFVGYLLLYIHQNRVNGLLGKTEIVRQTGKPVSEKMIFLESLQKKPTHGTKMKTERSLPHTIPTDHDRHSRIATSQKGGFHVILTFRLINDKVKGQARMKEYLWTLGQFLENNLVKQVHLMVDSQDIAEYIQKNIQENHGLKPYWKPNDSPDLHSGYNLTNIQHNEVLDPKWMPKDSPELHSGSNIKKKNGLYPKWMPNDSSDRDNREITKNGHPHPKLKFHRVESPDIVLSLHQLAFNSLQGELVVITQADIILGEGFEKVNRTLLAGKRMLYSLSRHESKCGTLKDQCEKYSGSHDTFVFVPDGVLTQEAKALLNHTIFSYGTENLVMYVYQHLLNYRILNPCRILRTYHHHCTNFRKYKKPQKWVNKLDERSKPVDRLI